MVLGEPFAGVAAGSSVEKDADGTEGLVVGAVELEVVELVGEASNC
jgi:hypothetical protein